MGPECSFVVSDAGPRPSSFFLHGAAVTPVTPGSLCRSPGGQQLASCVVASVAELLSQVDPLGCVVHGSICF